MDFNQLSYFNTVATFENMSRAAEALHVSQSSLSKNIAKLEDEVGYKLFDRNGKSIRLNAAGTAFLEYSKEALRALDAGVKLVEKHENESAVPVRIGIVGTFEEIARCAAEFKALHPESVFEIMENLSEKELPDMKYYDILICPDTPKYDIFEGLSLRTSKYCLAVNKKDPLASKIAISTKDLHNTSLVFIKRTEGADASQWELAIMGIHPQSIIYVNSEALQRALILEGAAAGLITDGSASIFEDSKNIKVLPIMDSRFNVPLKIAFKKERHRTVPADEFIRFLTDFYKLKQN